jgi:hypothetical protein
MSFWQGVFCALPWIVLLVSALVWVVRNGGEDDAG